MSTVGFDARDFVDETIKGDSTAKAVDRLVNRVLYYLCTAHLSRVESPCPIAEHGLNEGLTHVLFEDVTRGIEVRTSKDCADWLSSNNTAGVQARNAMSGWRKLPRGIVTGASRDGYCFVFVKLPGAPSRLLVTIRKPLACNTSLSEG